MVFLITKKWLLTTPGAGIKSMFLEKIERNREILSETCQNLPISETNKKPLKETLFVKSTISHCEVKTNYCIRVLIKTKKVLIKTKLCI